MVDWFDCFKNRKTIAGIFRVPLTPDHVSPTSYFITHLGTIDKWSSLMEDLSLNVLWKIEMIE